MQAVRELPESGPGHCRVIQVSAPRWFGDSQRLPAFWELEQKLSGLRTQSESEPPVFLFCLPIVYSVRRDADVVPPPCLTVGRPLGAVSQGRLAGAPIPHLSVTRGQGDNTLRWSSPFGLNRFGCYPLLIFYSPLAAVSQSAEIRAPGDPVETLRLSESDMSPR